jgi:hypothetical protein
MARIIALRYPVDVIMSGAALVLATLIGVFVTPDGVVVGSDTAIMSRGGAQAPRQKFCVTGLRAVATMQGVYELTDTETKTTIALHDRFREFCAKIDRTQLPATLRGQAEFIASELGLGLSSFLEDVPDREIVSKYSSNPVVARVAVSGYDEDGRAGSVVVGIGIATERATNRWQVQVRDLATLTFNGCGVRFHGQEVVALALRRNTDARVPKVEREKPEVQRLAALIGGSCSDASIRSAPRMFAEAARLTVTHGAGFGIPPGVVDLPLDIVVIPRSGRIEVSRVEAW